MGGGFLIKSQDLACLKINKLGLDRGETLSVSLRAGSAFVSAAVFWGRLQRGVRTVPAPSLGAGLGYRVGDWPCPSCLK